MTTLSKNPQGFTLIEMMAAMFLLSIIFTAGSMVFVSAQNLFVQASAQSDLQSNSIQVLQRISFELQGSGRDSGGNLKVTVLDNAGTNGTDIVRFSIPICPCNTSPMDDDGNVNHWGAPLVWGQAGCGASYTVDGNGKVAICHLPPGNPNNTQDLNVNSDAVKAHLAHGDYLGACNACNPSTYTNQTIEYSVDASKRLLRNVLNSANQSIASAIVALQVEAFQVSVNQANNTAAVIATINQKGPQGRTMSVTNSVGVLLRNR